MIITPEDYAVICAYSRPGFPWRKTMEDMRNVNKIIIFSEQVASAYLVSARYASKGEF